MVQNSSVDSIDTNKSAYYEYNNYRTSGASERSIVNELKKYSFHDDIVNEADVVYNKMLYRVRRSKVRSQMLFYCVYCAHRELNRPVNPTALGKIFGLTPAQVMKCDSFFSPLQTGYKPPHTHASPVEYLSGYCTELNLSEECSADMISLAQSILRKAPELLQERPETVAAGLIYYYALTNGITFDDPTKIATVVDRSMATIISMHKRISAIDNSI